MKKLILYLFIPVMLFAAGCAKHADIVVTPVVTATQGYIIVKCDNCKVDYGMPDQYRGFNVTTTSPKGPYDYKSAYTLRAYIYALGHAQKIGLTVYDTAGKVIYDGTNIQDVEGYWDVSVLLP